MALNLGNVAQGVDCAITPSDSAAVRYATLYIVTGGTIKIDDGRGATRTLTVTAGQYINCQVTKIYDSDTSLVSGDFWGYL